MKILTGLRNLATMLTSCFYKSAAVSPIESDLICEAPNQNLASSVSEDSQGQIPVPVNNNWIEYSIDGSERIRYCLDSPVIPLVVQTSFGEDLSWPSGPCS